MKPFQLILDRPEGAYFPGETITGRVECNFGEEKKCKAIKIIFHGAAKVEWTERHGRTTTTYRDAETYLNHGLILLSGGDNFKLPAGKHIYPFLFPLPERLPSTFKSVLGKIEYTATATFVRPWNFNHESKTALLIISPINLNYLPSLQNPIARSGEKTICCWCCESGLIELEVSLPKAGYVPTQDINVTTSVKNMSNVKIKAVKFTIEELKEYIVRIPDEYETKKDRSNIVVFTESGIGAQEEKTWTSTYQLPSNYYPNLANCSIIDITHFVKVTLVLSILHCNLNVAVPITIGSVPFSTVTTEQLQSLLTENDSYAAVVQVLTSPPEPTPNQAQDDAHWGYGRLA